MLESVDVHQVQAQVAGDSGGKKITGIGTDEILPGEPHSLLSWRYCQQCRGRRPIVIIRYTAKYRNVKLWWESCTECGGLIGIKHHGLGRGRKNYSQI